MRLQAVQEKAAEDAGEGSREIADVLINTSPAVTSASEKEMTISDVTKELLSDPSKRIKLDDFVSQQIKKFLEASDLRNFPIQGSPVTQEEFIARIGEYEKVTSDLQHVVILLAKWGEAEQLMLLEKIFIRLAEADKGSGSGLVVWLRLTWYPLMILAYSAGIAALSSRKYDALRISLTTKIQPDPEYGNGPQKLMLSITRNMVGVNDQFKWLPGSERAFVPESEHLFKALQPILEDELLLGRTYESLFDEFEILRALVYSESSDTNWGPPGRFAWKHSRGRGTGPFEQLAEEAKTSGANWGPLTGGLFDGSAQKLKATLDQYRQLLSQMHFW